MKKDIYIHIGTPKTGTTSIQNFCYQNRELLEKKYNLYYPVLDHEHPRKEANGNFFEENELCAKCAEMITHSKPFRVLISEEMIFLKDLVRFVEHDIFSKHNIKIILYLRNAADYLISLWGEDSKNLYSPPSMEQFIEESPYAEQLSAVLKISDTIGADNVILKPYERKQLKEGDVVTDFLDIFDIPIRDDFVRVERKNPSIDRQYCDIVQFLMEAGYALNKRNMNICLDVCSSGDKRKIIETITDAEIQRICDTYEPIEKELSEKVNEGKPIFLNRYPSCYGKERAPYQPISQEDIEKMHQAGLRKERHDCVSRFLKALKLKTRPLRYKIKELLP